MTACHSLHFKQPTSASACPGPLPPLRRFQAVLHTQAAGQASLRVVENNDFKQLPHLTLALRPGSDAALKQFLAFRLGELRSDCSQLSAELERTQVGAGWGGMGAWRIALKGTGNSDGSLLVAQRQWETLSTWPAPVPICPVCDLRRLPSPTTPAPAPALQSERNSLQNGLGEARRALAAEGSAALEWARERWRHVLVDEFQDTGSAMVSSRGDWQQRRQGSSNSSSSIPRELVWEL